MGIFRHDFLFKTLMTLRPELRKDWLLTQPLLQKAFLGAVWPAAPTEPSLQIMHL